MQILILGGTQMIGKNFVINLTNKYPNYKVTLANRNLTNKNLFPNLKTIVIDRNNMENCQDLEKYIYDIVVDFSCYSVEQFENTYKYLNYNKYIYISTMSVYESNIIKNPNLDEEYHNYCINKYLIERYIITNNIKNCLRVRPCAIYGDDDYTNRFYKLNGEFYWKHNNQKVGIGTMSVESFSELLLTHINQYVEIGSIDVCKKWWT